MKKLFLLLATACTVFTFKSYAYTNALDAADNSFNSL